MGMQERKITFHFLMYLEVHHRFVGYSELKLEQVKFQGTSLPVLVAGIFTV